MLKYVAPLQDRLRHLRRPHLFRGPDDAAAPTRGQQLAEQVAAFTGPVLLIAANVASLRDHRQYDRMEQMERRLLDEMAELRAAIPPKSPRKAKAS